MRYFTVEEAEALLPQIKEIFKKAQATKTLIEKKVEDWRAHHKNLSEADEAVIRSQVDFLASQLETQLGEISDLGCIPKDLDLGLVDFPARVGKQEGYLCWKIGDEKIQNWHNLTDGFEGRQKLEDVQ